MMFVALSEIATVSLGFKSLQNSFYYVNQATIDTFGIEKRFLTPILMLKSLNTDRYRQSPKPDLWLFNCRDKQADLRGTGALKYIESMADRSAAEKKQAGKNLTIREALEAQSGGLWYAPKAKPNRHHIWVRKAMDGVFAPFLFETPALVDQRCNSISPAQGIEWKDLAAVLSSTLFAYSVEINGSASMGAGALEAPTTKLRGYPVFDVRELSSKERKSLITLAEAMWKSSSPVDWSDQDVQPSDELKELDAWFLKRSKRNVSLETLYNDLRTACMSRISVAKDKGRKVKKQKADNIGSLAESITKAIALKVESRNFPENFANGAVWDIDLTFDRGNLNRITVSRLLGNWDISIEAKSGETVYRGSFDQVVAEAIIRSLLWGRSVFSVSSDRKAMMLAVSDFIEWFSKINAEIDKQIAVSALGTGYEDALRREVFSRLGVHPMAGANQLPSEIQL
jgi:hypothetical protein